MLAEALSLDHEFVYGDTPPDGVTVIQPLLSPKQVTFVIALAKERAVG